MFAPTAYVVMGNVAERLPAGISNVAGTWALGSELARVTVVPLAGATAVRVTEPVVTAPPITVLGETVTKCTATDAPIAKPHEVVFPP